MWKVVIPNAIAKHMLVLQNVYKNRFVSYVKTLKQD